MRVTRPGQAVDGAGQRIGVYRFGAHQHPDCAADGAGAGIAAQAGKAEVDFIRGTHRGRQDGRQADKAGHGFVARCLVEFFRRAVLQHAAVVEQGHAVGHGQGFFLVMGDQQGGGAELLLQGADLVAQLAADGGIQRRQRFIQQQGLRAEGQRPGQCHSLLLAAGHLARQAVDVRRQADQLQHFQRGLASCRLGHAAHLQAVGDVFGHGQVREQGVVLEHHADFALVHRHVGEIALAKADVAGVSGQQAGRQAQQGGFARAAGADQGDEFAALQGEVHIEHAHRRAAILETDLFVREAHRVRDERVEVREAIVASSSSTTVAAQAKPEAP
nr:hypothetical protein [Laribacter hongkongensis]